MGIFSFFKKDKSKIDKVQVIEDERKEYDMDNYVIRIPSSWTTYSENKRFKANSSDKSIELSVNVKPINLSFEENTDISYSKVLEQIINPLMDKFVNQGGYVEQEDRKFTNEFAYCSFLVDKRENHFHVWSLREENGAYFIYDQILKQDGNWNANLKQLHFEIFESLSKK